MIVENQSIGVRPVAKGDRWMDQQGISPQVGRSSGHRLGRAHDNGGRTLARRGARRGDQTTIRREFSSPDPQHSLPSGVGQSESPPGVSPDGHPADRLARHPRRVELESCLMDVPPWPEWNRHRGNQPPGKVAYRDCHDCNT